MKNTCLHVVAFVWYLALVKRVQNFLQLGFHCHCNKINMDGAFYRMFHFIVLFSVTFIDFMVLIWMLQLFVLFPLVNYMFYVCDILWLFVCSMSNILQRDGCVTSILLCTYLYVENTITILHFYILIKINVLCVCAHIEGLQNKSLKWEVPNWAQKSLAEDLHLAATFQLLEI